jgi:hypothetical protein
VGVAETWMDARWNDVDGEARRDETDEGGRPARVLLEEVAAFVCGNGEGGAMRNGEPGLDG